MAFEILILCLGIIFILTILGIIRYTYVFKSKVTLCFTLSSFAVFLYILTKINPDIFGEITDLLKNLFCALWIISYYVLNIYLFDLKKTNWLYFIIYFGIFYFSVFFILENQQLVSIEKNVLIKQFLNIASIVDLVVVFSILLFAFKNRTDYKKFIFIGTFFMLLSSSEFVISYLFRFFNFNIFWKKSDLFSVNLMVGVQVLDYIFFYTSFLILDKEKEIQFQKTLTASILETQEQLLQSISQDLHDDAGQQLTVINFQLENLKLDNKENAQFEAVSSSVMQLSHSLRKISHSLNPNWLENIGLIKAISNECERINEQKRIFINTKINNSSNRKLNKDVEIVVFRIFQESINNILKHAKASKIEILIETEPKLIIEVKDNGLGFNIDNQIVSDSIGLKNCINRAQLINFDYQISSKIHEGTTVVLSEK